MKQEQVILLDEQYQRIGQMDKAKVHHRQTPLHLGFSCYIVNHQGQVLLTRRALGKKTWPGVWSNSVCGHPAPDELIENAVIRRARHELGLNIAHPKLLVDNYHYWAQDVSGIVEHEYCPIFKARSISALKLNTQEVMDYQWVNPKSVVAAVTDIPQLLSPWMIEQVKLLQQRGLWFV